MSFLTIKEVAKNYGQVKVLQHVSLSLEKGEFVTLLGQSGCGKSTLLRSIAGLVELDEGTILLDGKDITNVDPRKREIGMVFQSYALFPNMTVFDNIAFGLKMKKKDKVKHRVYRMIEMMGLEGKEDSYPHQLSGGQQQRVALARSLVLEPKVLLLDEPLSALDAKIRKSLQQELKRIQRELQITTVFVTHDQEEAMTMSDTIHIMNEGKIVQSGKPRDIYTSPANTFVANFIGHYNVMSMIAFKEIVEQCDLQGKEIALRPEVLEIYSESDIIEASSAWTMGGKIKEVSMTGNVLRYEIEKNGTVFRVDQLHRDVVYHRGENVKVIIPKEECIVF
ncbi:ABC transporter ATP-binding protein [Bacillus kexueae]|uniref:ABC transporter ATP-binding protein n=1 Tax=Aeribacillus kexueae TaxID=2078952 RepID=UPI001FAF2F85|nr:ABC transporter ATP-binding protein [Bacillus kexueae]